MSTPKINIINKGGTTMLRLEQIKIYLRDRNLKAVARDTGLSYMTVRRVALGLTKPDYETIEKLSDYVEEKIAQFEEQVARIRG